VEIEPATFRAAPHFADLSGRVRDDPRFEILFRDGRTHLLRAPNAYDVIVSEPSNPWITGVSNLFTREFYALALARLAPGGVFGQWFHYYRFEPEDVKIELRTFAAVFPQVSLWLVPPVPGPDGPSLAADLLLVGSREEHALDWGRLRQAFAGEVGRDLKETGALEDEAALTAAFALGDRAFRAYADTLPAKAPRVLNTDDHPVIELVAPRRNLRPRAEIAGLAQAQYQALAGAAGADEPPVRGVPEEGRARFAAALGERYAAAGQAVRAEAAFERALRLDPSLADARERLSNLHLDRRDFPAAERGLRDLVRMRPQDVGARLRLGAVLARQAKWSEARDALREARTLDPKAPIDPALLEHVERMASRPE
jgi:spermidine synthase